MAMIFRREKTPDPFFVPQVGSEKQVLGPGKGTTAPAGEEHGVKNHTTQRLKVLVFVAPNPS
jgi:quercetin dioxygenase-like cupin family protein